MKLLHLDLKYVLVLFVINILWFIFTSLSYSNLPDSKNEYLFIHEGETPTYFEPLENLVVGKGYSWNTSTTRFGDYKEVASTRRVPGIGVIYLPLRKIMEKSLALDALIITQWLLHILSWVLLIGSAKKYFNIQSSRVLWTLVLLSSFSTFDKVFNSYGLAESLSNSALIASLSFFILYRLNPTNGLLLIAGCFSAWSIFLRPATGLFWGLSFIAISFPIFYGKVSIQKIQSSIVYMLPLMILLFSWGFRNYSATGSFVLLEDNIYKSQPATYTPIRKNIREVSLSLGERFEPWIEGSFGQFMFQEENSPRSLSDFAWDKTSSNLMLELRELDQNSQKSKDRLEIAQMDERSTIIRDQLLESVKAEMPFRYYFIAPISHLKDLLNKKFYSYLPFPPLHKMTLIQKVIKVWEAIYHYLLIGAFITIILMKPSFFRHEVFSLILVFPVAYIVVMSVVFGAAEPRYIVSVYPFLIFAFFSLVWNKRLKRAK